MQKELKYLGRVIKKNLLDVFINNSVGNNIEHFKCLLKEI